MRGHYSRSSPPGVWSMKVQCLHNFTLLPPIHTPENDITDLISLLLSHPEMTNSTRPSLKASVEVFLNITAGCCSSWGSHKSGSSVRDQENQAWSRFLFRHPFDAKLPTDALTGRRVLIGLKVLVERQSVSGAQMHVDPLRIYFNFRRSILDKLDNKNYLKLWSLQHFIKLQNIESVSLCNMCAQLNQYFCHKRISHSSLPPTTYALALIKILLLHKIAF